MAVAQGFPQDVHIVPLSVEYDRAVLPFLPAEGRPPFFLAHRIHLLVPTVTNARSFLSGVEKALKPLAEVRRHVLPRTDPRTGRMVEFEEVLRVVSRLCQQELAEGHRVHINLSTGTKLHTIASALAAMAYLRNGHGSSYYVLAANMSHSEAEFDAHGFQKGPIDVHVIDLLPLLLPRPLELRLLAYLHYAPNSTADYRTILRFLAQIPEAGYALAETNVRRVMRDRTNTLTTKMVRTLLTPLERAGLVEVRDAGRRREIRLTRHGRLYALLSAFDRDDLKRPLEA